MESQPKTILSLFEENELKVGQLYKIYSQKVSGHKKFWENISEEEIKHAEQIKQAYRDREDLQLAENKFSRGVIGYVMNFVDDKILETRKKDWLSRMEALETALRIEQSFLEKNIFELFVPEDRTVKEVFDRLTADTTRHIKMLRKEIGRHE